MKEIFKKYGIMIGLIAVSIVLIIVFWNYIYNNLLTPLKWIFGATKPTKEEKEKLKAIKRLKLPKKISGETYISDSEARSRADAIYNAMKGAGTTENILVKMLIKKAYWLKFDEYYSSKIKLSWTAVLNPLNFYLTDWTVGLRTAYNMYESEIALTTRDLIKIYKAFGIRDGHTGFYTLDEYLSGDDTSILKFYKYVYSDTDIIFEG